MTSAGSPLPPGDNSPAGQLDRCPCGFDALNPNVVKKARYGFWGWTALAMGATVVPKRVDVVCSRCGTILDSTSDPDEMMRHV